MQIYLHLLIASKKTGKWKTCGVNKIYSNI